MTIVGWYHRHHVAGRRAQRLAQCLAPLITDGAQVLDVGCGDGRLARRLMDLRPDISVRGVEVIVRPGSLIPVESFDGAHLPCADRSVDTVMVVDVLHHTTDPGVLLAEAARVARHSVLLKDHLEDGWLARQTLRVMDWVGNAYTGVALPYNYWSRREWERAFAALGLRVDRWTTRLGLYPMPASLVLDRSLHFVALLRPRA